MMLGEKLNEIAQSFVRDPICASTAHRIRLKMLKFLLDRGIFADELDIAIMSSGTHVYVNYSNSLWITLMEHDFKAAVLA